MPLPVIPDIPGSVQSDPTLTSVKVDVKAANTAPTPADQAEVSSISPNNTGLPVNLPSIVQKAGSASTAAGTTLGQAFTSANRIGNTIIVVAAAGSNGTLSVADTSLNTYYAGPAGASSSTFETQIFYAPIIANPVSGLNTVTLTTTASSELALEIYEVVGLLALAPSVLDQVGIGNATGTAVTTTPIAPSYPNEIAFLSVGVGTTAEAITAVAGSGWAVDASLNPTSPSNLFSFGSLSQVLGDLSGITPKATVAASKAWCACVATFRPVALGVQGSFTIGGYNYTRVTSAATTLVKTGRGILHAVVVNKPTATATLELDDALTNTTPIIGIMLMPTTAANPFTVVYDVEFNTGLSATVAVATIDATIVWK